MSHHHDVIVVFASDSYNATFVTQSDYVSDDEYVEEDDEIIVTNNEPDIFSDEHPWDTLHERRYRHRPDIWLYGINPVE